MNELTKKESTELVEMNFEQDEAILTDEIIIPKLLVMQPGSTLVTQGEATFGQMVDSMTGEALGSMKEPLEFIPFFFERVFYVSKKVDGRYKFDRITPFTPKNKDTPYETTYDGVQYKCEKAWQYYVMLPKDMSMPRILTFKGMSRRAGEILYTEAYVKTKMLKKRHVDFVYELTTFKKENEKGVFAMIKATKTRDTTKDEISLTFPWFKAIKDGMAKAHSTTSDTIIDKDTKPKAEQAELDDIPDQF